MKTVLITIDYNPTAQKVAGQGYELAKEMKAHVVLLHVVSDVLHYTSSHYSSIMGFEGYLINDAIATDLDDSLVRESEKYLEKIKEHLDDEHIKIKVKQGEVAPIILETAQKVRADVIVMGSHSRRWLEEIVIGSVTRDVLEDTRIPLFIIPTKKGQ